MPKSELHQKKLKKNLTIAGMVFLWCAIIWAVTMIRIAKADEYQGRTASATAMCRMGEADCRQSFHEGREQHTKNMIEMREGWDQDYSDKEPQRRELHDFIETGRTNHQDHIIASGQGFAQDWNDKAGQRQEMKDTIETGRENWSENIRPNPQKWWEETRARAYNE